MVEIAINRKTRYPDRFRAYEILIDGSKVGSVGASQSATILVTPGVHSLGMKIDWCRSNVLHFEALVGNRLVFDCGSNMTGWRMFLMSFNVGTHADSYLWLKQVD
jgi:hypothetical protein